MTKIEWCMETWNPVVGCPGGGVSPGCEHCYARIMARRLHGTGVYPEGDEFGFHFYPKRLSQPSKWRKPRSIFVCSMGDMFHHDVSQGAFNATMNVIAGTPRHTFIMLTKRPEHVKAKVCKWVLASQKMRIPAEPPNLWLGISAENQAMLILRWPILADAWPGKKLVSLEPLLGPINISPHGAPYLWRSDGHDEPYWAGPDWVIVGGETNPGARPMHPAWVRRIRDDCQCIHGSVPLFFKSWGGRSPKRAGRELDGREWNEKPKGMP